MTMTTTESKLDLRADELEDLDAPFEQEDLLTGVAIGVGIAVTLTEGR